jgi:hypothetical protein
MEYAKLNKRNFLASKHGKMPVINIEVVQPFINQSSLVASKIA